MELFRHHCCSWCFSKSFKLLLLFLPLTGFIYIYFQISHESGMQFKPTLRPQKKSIEEKLKIQNPIFDQKICNLSFPHGEMCPPRYTELGGKCTYVKGKINCPDIRQKANTPLRSTQLVLTRMLKIFGLIARAHNITYWITSGTLLGAARHHGFIPWDEDADLQMPLKEYVKLYKCCRDRFPKDMFFQNSKTDRYLKPPKDKREEFVWHPKIGFYQAPWNPRLRDLKSCTTYCLQDGCKWEDGLMIDIFIAEDYLTSKQRAGVFPLQYMTFEGFKFPVPNNWETILRDKYGDYMNDIGGEDKRVPQDNSNPFQNCSELKNA